MTIIKEVKTISAKNTPHTLAARNGKYVCVDCKRVFFSPNPQTACAGKVETKPQVHTPGPWELVLEKCWGWCVKVGKDYIAFRVRKKEDASLISAAPELLSACQKLAQWDAEGDDSDMGARMISEACSMARAAIRKAVQS